jgi:SAM-dependent methyltransferase
VSAPPRDRWAEWLLERRFGGDAAVARQLLDKLAGTRDRVLDCARLAPGETLLDVGCGDGLIAFGALERGAGGVVFADVSEDLLELCRERALELGESERCRFVHAPAERLDGVEDASVDVATTRSVLIYVADKEAAFGELHRVLRPGGRISVWEPINSFGMERRRCDFGYDLAAVAELARRVEAVFAEIQPDDDPMLDFDERDLLRLAETAGFFPVELELHAEIVPTEPRTWESFVRTSGNPLIPTLDAAMEEALSPDERERLVEVWRPQVEEGRGVWRMATAHLWAERR